MVLPLVTLLEEGDRYKLAEAANADGAAANSNVTIAPSVDNLLIILLILPLLTIVT